MPEENHFLDDGKVMTAAVSMLVARENMSRREAFELYQRWSRQHNRSDHRPIWLIYGGYGQDGGFGDYAEPIWDDEPLHRPDGTPIWFEDGKKAETFAKRLSDREASDFYAQGEHGPYDGNFPYEYTAVKTYAPATPSADDDTALADTLPLHGGSSYSPQ